MNLTEGQLLLEKQTLSVGKFLIYQGVTHRPVVFKRKNEIWKQGKLQYGILHQGNNSSYIGCIILITLKHCHSCKGMGEETIRQRDADFCWMLPIF